MLIDTDATVEDRDWWHQQSDDTKCRVLRLAYDRLLHASNTDSAVVQSLATRLRNGTGGYR